MTSNHCLVCNNNVMRDEEREKALRYLVEKGASVDETLAHCVSEGGSMKMYLYVRELGVDFSVKTNDGLPTYFSATENKDSSIVGDMIDRGEVDVNYRTPGDNSTALLWACFLCTNCEGNLKAVQF